MMTKEDIKIIEMIDELKREIVDSGNLSSQILEMLGDAVDIKKDIIETEKCELIVEEMLNSNSHDNMNSSGYSGHMPYWMIEQGYSGDQNMSRRYSMANTGNRDSYGRTSRMNYNNYGYSRTSSEEDMMKRLEDMANNAETPEKREMYRNFAEELKNRR